MEAGDGSAGNGDEHEAPYRSSSRVHVVEVGPDLRCVVVRIDHGSECNADSHEYKADTEYRIDLTDDLINGKECSYEIVDKYYCKPYRGGRERTGHALIGNKGNDKSCRSYSENGTYHDKKDN